MSVLKMFDLKTILLVVLGLVVVFVYFSKESEISTLKSEYIEQSKEFLKAKDEIKKLDDVLQRQNRAIEDMRVEVAYIEPKAVEKIKNIYIKDSSCEAELRAYKELFDE